MTKTWMKLAVAGVSVLMAAGRTDLARAEEQEAVPVKFVKYTDNFSDPKKSETDSETMNNVKVFAGIGLSSENSNNGFVIYDLDNLIPTRDATAKVVLVYDGRANGPAEKRGVTWAVSTDGKEWKDISTNEFNKPVEFTGKYVKASLRWIQASTPDYGFLKQFSFKTTAKK